MREGFNQQESSQGSIPCHDADEEYPQLLPASDSESEYEDDIDLVKMFAGNGRKRAGLSTQEMKELHARVNELINPPGGITDSFSLFIYVAIPPNMDKQIHEVRKPRNLAGLQLRPPQPVLHLQSRLKPRHLHPNQQPLQNQLSQSPPAQQWLSHQVNLVEKAEAHL